MFSNPVFWVVAAIVLLLAVIYLRSRFSPSGRATAMKRAQEKLQKEQDEQAVKAKEKRQLENFQKQRLVVYVREKDGRKCSFEAVLIKQLLTFNIDVKFLRDKDGKDLLEHGIGDVLQDGSLALVGTAWLKKYQRGGCVDLDTIIPYHEIDAICCDYRLLNLTAGTVNILGAGYQDTDYDYQDLLAFRIICDLAKMLETPEKSLETSMEPEITK
jgi:hypothetical protein